MATAALRARPRSGKSRCASRASSLMAKCRSHRRRSSVTFATNISEAALAAKDTHTSIERNATGNEMALLSERQQKAEQLSQELRQLFGIATLNPMPLADDAKLRFQVLDADRNRVVEQLCAAGWIPAFVSPLPKVTTNGLIPAGVFEVTYQNRGNQYMMIAPSAARLPLRIGTRGKHASNRRKDTCATRGYRNEEKAER